MNYSQEEELKYQLKQLGFKPRENTDLVKYLKYLKYKLRRNGKDLKIEEKDNHKTIEIVVKGEMVKKDKKLFFRATEEDCEKYKYLIEKRNTNLAKLIRDLLDREYEIEKEKENGTLGA